MSKCFKLFGPALLCLSCLFAAHGQSAPPTTPTLRVALVSTCATDEGINAAALATAELSQDRSIILVERDAVERILREQDLWRCGLSDAQQALAAGRLLGVDVFVVIESFAGAKGQSGVIAFDATTGVRLCDVALTAANPQPLAAEIAAAVRNACTKRKQVGPGARTVCVLSVRNAGLPRELASTCEAFGRLLERQLLGSPSLSVLERQRLDQVNAERNLPGNDLTNGLLKSLTLLEVEVAWLNVGKGLKAAVFLTDPAGRVMAKVEASAPDMSPGELVGALLPQLLKALDAAALTSQPDYAREAQRFYNESIFLWNDGQPAAALSAAEAAAALAPEQVNIRAQLARCLAAKAVTLFGNPTNDLKISLPFAIRAGGICRQVRRELLATTNAPPGDLIYAESILLTKHRSAWLGNESYLEKALGSFKAQNSETQTDLRQLQQVMREIRLQLDVQYWHSRITNYATAIDFGEAMDIALLDAENLAPSSEGWSADINELMTGWLAVFGQYRLSWGGWSMSDVRPLARLCIQAGGCAVSGRRLGDWELQPRDLDRLRDVFQRMEQHSNSIVQCYGHVGRFALAVRGKTTLDEATLTEFQAAKAFILAQLAALNAKSKHMYNSLTYDALRDLIDIAPDAAFRRLEHLELFELMLARRDVTFWTTFMAVDPGAKRFAQFHRWSVPFPVDPAGYTPADYPMLHANEQRVRALFVSTNRTDVDATTYSYVRGSFERELDLMRSHIFEGRPDLATNSPPPKTYTKAQTLLSFNQPINRSIIRSVLLASNEVLAIVSQAGLNGARRTECLRLPLTGGPATSVPITSGDIGNPNFSLRAALDRDAIYVNDPGGGVYARPLSGGPPRMIDQAAGLLSSHVETFTVADGKLYAMLAEGQLVAFDLKSNRCDVLASRHSKEKRSPLEEVTSGFEVLGLVSDPARHRVLFSTRFHEVKNCHPLIGLWQIDTRTDEMKQILQTYYPVTWMARNEPDELLLYCPRNVTEAGCKPSFFSLSALDLRTDSAKVLWSFNQSRPIGPTLTNDVSTIRREIHLYPPFLHAAGWLWFISEGYARLSLTTSAAESWSPPEPEKHFSPFSFRVFGQTPGGKQILVADQSHIWLLTLPENSPKDSKP